MASNWAIVIGINQYRFLQPLRYAKRDAEAMSKFLRQEARFDRIFLFTDDSPEIGGKPTEPFRANLLRVLRQIFATPFMKDGDNFWFFFSGHGIRHNEQDYLMPLDGDPEDVENTGIPTQLISNYLRSCGADNVVMILDACRSGGKKSGEGIGKQTEEEARQTGVISIFSCSPYEYSYELESIEQGAFTYSLVEGLGIRGRCATVERLNQYLQSQVPQLVQQIGRVRQTPYTIAEPLNRSHLILMPQHASLADIATLKNDAYNAEIAKNWELARRLWLRVLVAASGQDMDAVNAIERIGQERFGGFQPTASPLPSSTPLQSPLKSVTPLKPLPDYRIASAKQKQPPLTTQHLTFIVSVLAFLSVILSLIGFAVPEIRRCLVLECVHLGTEPSPSTSPIIQRNPSTVTNPSVSQSPSSLASPTQNPSATAYKQAKINPVDPGVSVNVRNSPSTAAAIQSTARSGDVVYIIDTARGDDGRTWYLVEFESGVKGWVRSDFLRIDS